MDKTWLNARDLYRDLAIPGIYMTFEDWFTARIQSEFRINDDWVVQGEGDDLTFLITEEVAASIARDEIGLPVSRLPHFRKDGDFPDLRWNQENNPQTHAITGDDDL